MLLARLSPWLPRAAPAAQARVEEMPEGGGGAEGGGKGGGLDAAGERGRAQAAIAALSRAGGQPSSGPPPIQGAADGAAADELRGEK